MPRDLSDSAEDIGQLGALLFAVELCGLDHGIEGGGGASAVVGTSEEPVRPLICRCP